MKKFIIAFILLGIITIMLIWYLSAYSFTSAPNLNGYNNKTNEKQLEKLKQQSISLLGYAKQHSMNTEFCYIADFSIASGSNRFFVYSFKKDSILHSGLVAHGSCNTKFLLNAKFSNEPGAAAVLMASIKLAKNTKEDLGQLTNSMA